MILIVARHGRTFEPHEQPVYIGAHEDPPLTADGRIQGRALGRCLRRLGSRLRAMDASPMARTQQMAQLAATEAGWAGAITSLPVLRELDYGTWAGRSSQAMQSTSGDAAMAAWNDAGHYPPGAGFAPPREEVLAGLQGYLAGLNQRHPNPEDVVLAVSHGGVLRLLAACVVPPPGARTVWAKMACGHVGVIEVAHARAVARAWNVAPEAVSAAALCPPDSAPTL